LRRRPAEREQHVGPQLVDVASDAGIPELDADVREPLVKGRQRVGEDKVDRHALAGDDQRTGGRLGAVAQRFIQRAMLFDQRARLRHVALGVGQGTDRRRLAIEQRDAELGLERTDQAVHRRCRKAKTSTGCGKAAVIGHCNQVLERAQLVNCHGGLPVP
jgi:hypothetical protein